MSLATPDVGAPVGTWRRWGPWLAMLLLGLVSLWLHAALPIQARGDAWWDERLFVELAKSVARGHWLGDYGPGTLSKGPFYPIFIAANFYLGLPLKIAEQLVYLLAGGLLCGVAARLIGRWPAVALFALLAFNPVQWTALTRVLRENIYGAEALLLFAIAARLYLTEGGTLGRPQDGRLGWPLALGAALAAYWLTREEGPWLLPSLGLLLLYWLVGRYRAWRAGPAPRRWWLGELRFLALPVAVFLCCLAAVNTLNWKTYGVWRSNDFSASPGFVAAYGAITRIKAADTTPRLLFTREARQQAYRVSPAARELAPALDGDLGKGWARATCLWGGDAVERSCTEIISGWLPWALRDAVRYLDSHFRTAPAAEAYWRRLADEINTACDAGRIDCLPPRASLMPPLPPGWEWERRIAERLLPSLAVLVTFGEGWHTLWPSAGQPAALGVFQDMTGGRLAPIVESGKGLFVRGWLAEASGQAEVTLGVRPGAPPQPTLQRSVELTPRPEIEVGLPVTGFYISSNCGPPDCELVVQRPGKPPLTLAVDFAMQPGTRLIDSADAILMLDEIGPAEWGAGLWMTRNLTNAKLGVMKKIAGLYARVMPVVAGLAVFAFLAVAAVELRRRTLSAGTVLAAALLGAALLRVGLLAWIDATSFHVLEPHYMSPAHPLLLAFCGLALALAGRGVARNFKRAR